MIRLQHAFVPVLVLAVALSGCTRVGTAEVNGHHAWTIPGTLRIGTTDEPDSLDPLYSNNDAAIQVEALIFAPVFRYGPNGDFVPELATEVPTYANGGISRDSKTITLHWRQGVKWSDGAPLLPSDLVFTWHVVMDPKNPVRATYGWDDIASMDVPDDRTVIVHLKRPNADVIGIFGGGGGTSFPPLPEHLLKHVGSLYHADFNAHPISSGPWLLTAWNHGSSIEFAPNPKYWRGSPKLQHLEYRIIPNPDTLLEQLRTHEVDLVQNVRENDLLAVRALPGIRAVMHTSANWRHMMMNVSRPGLRDITVRRAIAEAIDWKRIDQKIFRGIDVPATSDVPPGSWADPHEPPYPYDPSAAIAMLQAAGYVPGPGGIRAKGDTQLAFTIFATNQPANELTEVQMQQDLKHVGIGLVIKNVPAAELFSRDGPLYKGNYDLEFSIDTNGPDPDDQGLWSADFIPPHGGNTSWLNDPLVTRLSAQALLSFDRSVRKPLYKREEDRIHELIPCVFIYWETAIAAYNDDLKNYRPAQYLTDNWNSWEWSI